MGTSGLYLVRYIITQVKKTNKSLLWQVSVEKYGENDLQNLFKLQIVQIDKLNFKNRYRNLIDSDTCFSLLTVPSIFPSFQINES
jgi:hypothetical protein